MTYDSSLKMYHTGHTCHFVISVMIYQNVIVLDDFGNLSTLSTWMSNWLQIGRGIDAKIPNNLRSQIHVIHIDVTI